jgi:PAS domain-containing protein
VDKDKQIDGQAESHLVVEESGIYTWDLKANVLQGDTSVARLFGVIPSVALEGLPIEDLLDRIHSDDRPRVAKSIHHAILTGDPYHEVYRVLGHADYNDVAAFGRCFRDSDGTPNQYAGIVVKVGNRENATDPVLSHVALAHKVASEAGRVDVADALEQILEDLRAEARKAGRSENH